jgi:flagella synthesis protein FlgN
MTTPHASLSAEQAHLTDLLGLMQQEQALLVAADADGLAQLTPRKASLVQALAACASTRHAALAQAGFDSSEAGMAAWIDARGDAAAQASWQALLAQAAEAKERNRVNGMLINRQMAHNQTVLAALRTPTASLDAPLYGAKGQTFGSAPSRRFVVG